MQGENMVGGRCLGKPWLVGIAGVAHDDHEQVFALDEVSWQHSLCVLPWQQLKAYGDANGLVFERIVAGNESVYDALLLLVVGNTGVALSGTKPQVRRYLLLQGEQPRFSAEQETAFARIFLPLGEPFTDGRLVCLNQPLLLPISQLKVSRWTVCADDPELPGLLSPQWRECLENGVVPVHTADWSVPDWMPQDSYIDARNCTGDSEVRAYCDARVGAAAGVLQGFLFGESSYPYSVEYWIVALTAAIACDVTETRKNWPLLSVIIPTYNYGHFLRQTVSSVLGQGVDDIEILVLDNASTDNTAEIIQAYADEPRVRYLRNLRNVGPRYNVLNGIHIARGRYLSMLMADDYFNPGYLSNLLPRLLSRPEVVIGYTAIRWVNEHGQPLPMPRHPGYCSEDYTGGRNELAELLIHDNYIAPTAALIQREPFLSVCRSDPNLIGAGDWLAMLQVAEKYPDFIFMSEPGVSYRAHSAQFSNEFYSSNSPLTDHIRILEGVFKRGTESKIRGRELEVAAHLRRRLALYPDEQGSPLGMRVRNLCEQFEELAALGESSLFSIILTTYNRPDLLKDALASVGSQTLRDFEVILINDNGEPVEHLLAAYDFPITYIRQGRNQGLSAARNAGLALARGRYIVYLDDDDIYLPNHLAVLAEAFEQHPGSVIYTGVEYVNEKLKDGQRIELGRGQPFKHEVFDRDRLFVQNYIPVNTWAHPRQMLATVGEFDTSLAAFEDWDMLLRLATRYPFVHVQMVTSEVHTREPGAGGDHMLGRERKNFPALYQLLYQRYLGSESEVLKRERGDMLQRLGISADRGADVPALQRWLAARLPTAAENRLINEYLQEHDGGPLIGIIVLDLDGQSVPLMQTLKSLIGERCLYSTLKIVVLTSSADVPKTSAGDKLHFVRLSDASLAAQINHIVSESDFSWFMLARAGDEFTSSGLMVAGLELAANPECRAIYGDHLQRLPDGSLGGAFLPSFNLDLLLSFPLVMARHWLFRRDVFLAVGGFDTQFAEALEFDLLVRLIEGQGLVGLGHVDEPLLITDAPALRDNPDERRVIERHLAQRGYQARVVPGLPARYRIDYGHSNTPLVSIIIAVDTSLACLQRCLESVLEKTRYGHYEILFGAHHAMDADTQAWLQGIADLADARLRVVAAADITQAQHQAALAAQGEYLLLLSAEAVAVSDSWLEELLNHAQRPEVGVVGGKLLSGDGRIDQAGLLLGLRGPAGRAFAGEAMDSAGYLQRLQVDQNYSAVSDACLMVRAEIYHQVGGLDTALSAYRDVDFCLRVRSAGYLIVWAAHAVLMHDHVYREPDVAEQDALYERHLPVIARDPAYNRNLALSGRGFDLEADAGLTWRPLSWRPLPVILAHPADPFGCGNYRVIKPFSALKEHGMVDGMMSIGLLQVPDLERLDPDVIVLQRQIGDERLDAMRRIKKFSRAFTIYELDDYLPNLPLKSVHRPQMPKDILKSLRKGLSFVDRFTVSTAPLAEAFAGLHGDIRVVENRLPVDWWSGLSSKRQRGRKPRVGWAGGVSHTGDLELITDVVKELAGEVEWVFMGMCPDRIRPYVHELHAGVAIDQYPAALARLDLDLALAPVEQNLFNECKSNLRLLEYGACGFPVVCSDLVCYQGALPVTRVKNRFKDWVDAIRMHISDLEASARMGDELRRQVQGSWMLDGANIEAWRASWLPD